jgi:hydroxylamine reductase
MFCFQCEQTAKGTGCTNSGVCGKDAETASLQDLLGHALKGLGMLAHRARGLGVKTPEADAFVLEGLFATVTNVDFDPARLEEFLRRLPAVRDKVRQAYLDACAEQGKTPEGLSGPATWVPEKDRKGLVRQGEARGIPKRREARGEDTSSVEEVVHYGLKGLAAYAHHAAVLGVKDDRIHAFVHEALSALGEGKTDLNGLVGLALRTGEANLWAMEALDKANTTAYGHPEPTKVRVEPLKGKAILVSGHDLKDLEELLKQTQGRGINVYTHGEMLPALAYPGLKKYKHLAGNYGGAWQDQRKEFEAFPGAILMTTNCIQKPQDSYQDRIFTAGLVAWPGVKHVSDRNFAPVIAAALKAPGFAADGPDKKITIGFGRNAVMGVAGAVIEAVKKGAIRRFFLIGGCDGAKSGRNYYTELARAVPKDCVILTLACGKYRFNKEEFGDIGGIPRLLDVGQCNDAYSAIQIAAALAGAFKTDVNGLPLSIVLSWYEQKAVAILLTLLHLGIKNIRIGPSLPAFVSSNVLLVLVEKFGLKPTTTPEEDLKAMLG